MVEPVKGAARPEQARTRLAKRAVVDAARDLFVERGFAGTSIEAISEAAGVPQATVYRLFSTKVGILKALLDTSIAGDDEPVAVQDRPEVAGVLARPDPAALLAGFAGVASAINQRTHVVHRVLLGAADADPGAAALLAELDAQRARGQGQVTKALRRAGGLREGVSAREAADVVHALASPEVFRLLVVDRRWSPARYERWLAETLAQQLT